MEKQEQQWRKKEVLVRHWHKQKWDMDDEEKTALKEKNEEEEDDDDK